MAIEVGLERMMLLTPIRYGAGGKTTMSTLPCTEPHASTTPRASALDESTDVFIFQLPPTYGLRSDTLNSNRFDRPVHAQDRLIALYTVSPWVRL